MLDIFQICWSTQRYHAHLIVPSGVYLYRTNLLQKCRPLLFAVPAAASLNRLAPAAVPAPISCRNSSNYTCSTTKAPAAGDRNLACGFLRRPFRRNLYITGLWHVTCGCTLCKCSTSGGRSPPGHATSTLAGLTILILEYWSPKRMGPPAHQ